MTKTVGVDVSNTASPTDIRLEPEVVDVLPSRASLPEELPKFCFPDDIYLSTEPFSLKTFDIVLTDIKGMRSYGSCLHFCEEKHPMDVLSLISATEKGRTANLPSWVYGYLLTEKKVVLTSANRPILTHVAETLRALLHPFVFQQVYIPLLPLSLVEFICAPVPFFMGVRSDQRLERLVAEGVILVDLDNNDIRVPLNEVLPLLTDVKSRKLLHTLRKLSIWSASQRTRHSFGHGCSTDERPLSPEYEPSQPSVLEVGQASTRHDELTEKWSEIQALFSSFSIRILKDVRKHCTRTGAPGNNSADTVVFDERGFLAMHPSFRDFCSHLFQTQLFQRSIENIWTFSDTSSSGSEPEQYWKSIRAKGMLRKNSEGNEDTKSQRRRVNQAPLPPKKLANSKIIDKSAGLGFPALNGKLYDELLEEFIDFKGLGVSGSEDAGPPIRPLSSLGFSSEASSISILTSPSFHDGDVDAFQLVNAARKRLEGRRGEIMDQ
ncbi:DENN domain-containing protein 4C [Phytophthora nicotianae]|uniref:DENN domain-containing protein 4C n=1 Tax=Phytophthora nicotianae TaxID=4792 RepID=A0A0W8E081_PHYNI|nr:DENN domain-containing protein 4C [Phytophthora nicotianae]